MKRLRNASAILAAAALFGFGLSSCDYTGDTTFDAALAANTAPSPSGGSGSEDDNSVTYDFSKLTAADATTLGVELTGSADIKFATTPNTATTPYMVLNGKVGIVTTLANKLRLKPKNGEPLAIGFNTNGLNQTVNNTTTVGETVQLDHFITYPVTSGKKYQFAISTNGIANNTAHYFVITNTSGKILSSKVCSASTTDSVTMDAFEATESLVRLSVYRPSDSGTSYVGKVVIKEITTDVKVTGITVSAAGSATSVKINKTLQLSTTVTPSNATSSSVTWTSSDTSKATVSSSGLVTGVAAGSVTITAKATDGSNVTGTIDLTVEAGSDELSETSITVNRAATSAATKSFTLTLGTTQFNAAGLSALVADFDISSYITESSTTNLTISDAKVTSAATTSTLAFQFKVATTAASGTTGKIKVTIPANVLVSGSAIEKEISYSVVEQTSATAKTYNFVGVNVTSEGLLQTSSGDAIALPSRDQKNGADTATYTLAASLGVAKIKIADNTIVGASSAGGKLKLETSSATASDIKDIIIECSTSSNGLPSGYDSVTISELKNYLSFPVDGAGTVTVTSTIGTSGSATTETCVAALYDGSGNKICVSDSFLAKDGGTPTLTGTVSDATTVYIVFFRSAGKGSLKVTKIDVAP